jgi:flagellar FliL protein
MAEDTKDDGAKKKKSGGKGLIVIIVALLAAGGGVGAGIFLFGGGGKEAKAESGAKGGGHGEKKAAAKHGGGDGNEEGAAAGPAVVPFDPFIVNLADPKGDRFLKLGLRAVVNDATLVAAFRTDELLKARVRDRVISVLTSKSYADISSTAGKEGLRQELRSEMNSVLPEESIEEVLFVEFAVQ